jgi:hypothetical protein
MALLNNRIALVTGDYINGQTFSVNGDWYMT